MSTFVTIAKKEWIVLIELYNNIAKLCEERGIKPGKMCADLGLSRSMMTDLKAGRKKSVNVVTLNKIANYFNVSLNELLEIKGPSEYQKELRDAQEEVLLTLFDQLSPDARSLVISQLLGIVQSQADQDAP